jgi:nucleoside-diphosphate-sugar epimerase
MKLTIYPEIKKAKKILSWKPEIPFNKGVDIIIKYYKKPY